MASGLNQKAIGHLILISCLSNSSASFSADFFVFLDFEAFAVLLLAAFFFVPLLALVLVAAFVFLTGLLFVAGLFGAVALPVFFSFEEATAFLAFTAFAGFFSSAGFVALGLVTDLRFVMTVPPELSLIKIP
jgi:hypothetical protein